MERSANLKIGKAVALLSACCFFFVACGGTAGQSGDGSRIVDLPPPTSSVQNDKTDLDAIEALPAVDIPGKPTAPETAFEFNEYGIIDFSNATDGYVMVKYVGDAPENASELKVRIVSPEETRADYIYYIPADGEYYAFPLSDGDGQYNIGIFRKKNSDPGDSTHVALLQAAVTADLSSEFAPFLLPNQLVNYDPDSLAIKLAKELSKDQTGVIEKTRTIYEYIISHIVYDNNKAATVESGGLRGYIPDIEETLRTEKGICYDYAVLMTAMLRGMDIPAKLVFGYASRPDSDPVYHAWILVYSDETGWIDLIEFAGESWTRMDPTFASGGNSKSIQQYIGDGNNYTESFLY